MDPATDTTIEQARPADPVVRWMAFVAGLLVVVLLGGVLAFTLHLRSIQAPRTLYELDLEAARAAVAAAPQVQANHLRLATAYAALGRYDDGLETVRRALQLGETPDAAFTEADILRVAGRYDEAIAAYDRAEPLAVEAHEDMLAGLRAKRVMEAPPNRLLARILFGRGLCFLELGEPVRAEADFEQALEITPTDAALLVALGDARLAAGEADGAREAYSAALGFVPGYAPAVEGLRALDPAEGM